MPAAINARGYTAEIVGKLKINTTQGLPSAGADDSWSEGVLQTANNTTSVGKAIVQNVSCPFKLTVNHAAAGTGTRNLVITFNGTSVYNQGSGGTSPGLAAVIDSATASSPCTTGSTTIEAYGHNGTNGAGVRIYDLKIEQ